MKTPMNDCMRNAHQTPLSLKKLVSQILTHFQPAAVRHRSFLLNEIPDNFLVNADENILTSVIGSLFSAVINKSKNACIRVSAKTYNNIVVVNVRDSNNSITIRIPKELEEAQPLAEQLGGCITLNHQWNDVTTVAFSFFSPSIAA
jgi:signal transduction histidine kinase